MAVEGAVVVHDCRRSRRGRLRLNGIFFNSLSLAAHACHSVSGDQLHPCAVVNVALHYIVAVMAGGGADLWARHSSFGHGTNRSAALEVARERPIILVLLSM